VKFDSAFSSERNSSRVLPLYRRFAIATRNGLQALHLEFGRLETADQDGVLVRHA